MSHFQRVSSNGPLVLRGADALAMLGSAEFVAEWNALYDDCPWACVYASPHFALTWFQIYRPHFDPVAIYARGGNRRLIGLFVGTIPRSSREKFPDVFHVGTHHAEYQTWLSRPDDAPAFIAAVLDALAELGARGLRFLYLAPGTPVDWTERPTHRQRWWRAVIRWHQRGLMTVSSGSRIEASLKKSGNRSKLSRLRAALGDVTLVRLKSDSDLEKYLDAIAVYTDVRQGGANGSLPFTDDPLKKAFYLSLMRMPEVAHATVLVAGDTLVAAHIGVLDRGVLSLGLISHAPQYAQYSPGKLLVLMLARSLAEEGREVFDLTPGGSYKERFATHHGEVAELQLYFKRRDYYRYRLRRAAVSLLRRSGLERIARSQTFGRIIFKTGQIASSRRVIGKALTAAKDAARWINSTSEFRYFCRPVEGPPESSGPTRIRTNNIADLLLYRPALGAQRSLREFLSSALTRLESGEVLFTATDRGALVHFGWLIPATRVVGSDYGHRVALSNECAVLYDDYTHPEARGRGLQYESILARLRYAHLSLGNRTAVAGIRADNGPSRHNYGKAGFQFCGSAWRSISFGNTRRWVDSSELLISCEA